jgi:peptidoglycan/xylan/chitin deacetylase (PgdA/CDA1 family)
MQVIFLTALLTTALPTPLPPQLISSGSIGPATAAAELFTSRLQRRRASHNWNDYEDEDQGEEEDEYETPLEWSQEYDDDAPPQEEAWPQQEEWPEQDEVPQEEERVHVSSAPVQQQPTQEPKEQRVRVASAAVEDTNSAPSDDATATSASAEDNTPVSAASYNPDMRKGIDYSQVPAIPPKPVGSGTCPGSQCAPGDCEKCWETCGNCPRKEDYYGCTNKNEWALSFDDGPKSSTNQLLDTLKKKNIKATFFVMGGQAAKHPDIIRRMFKEGHEVASHTYSHPHLMSLTDDQVVAEIKQTEDIIANLTGVHPRYIRPPYGEADDRVKAIMHAHGLQAILWNMDTLDYDIIGANKDIKGIVQAFDKTLSNGSTGLNPFNNPGFISLQHDIYLQSVQQETDIIGLLQSKGLKLVTVSQCTGDGKPYKDGNTAQPSGPNPVPGTPVQPVDANPVQPSGSNPVPGAPVQPSESSSVVPDGASPIVPVSSFVADGPTTRTDPQSRRLKDNAKQPAGGFIVRENDSEVRGADEPVSSASLTYPGSLLVVLLSTLVVCA